MIQVQNFSIKSGLLIEDIKPKGVDEPSHEPHSHNFWEIGYFEKGRGTHTIDFVEKNIDDRVLYFLKKGIVHTMSRHKDSFGKVLMFDESMLKSSILYDHLFYAEPHLCLDPEQFLFFKQLMTQLEYQIKLGRSSAALSVKYLELILEFYAQYTAHTIEAASKLQQFLLFVENHYSAKLTVEACLEQLNMSYNQLYTEARSKLQRSPIDLIKERTILQAKRLLFNTENSVKEIAYELDFEDSSYFSKYFKLEVGCTPLEFRNTQRH